MRRRSWKTDTVFVAALGSTMALFMGVSFFVHVEHRTANRPGSGELLRRMIEDGKTCATVTDDDVTNHTPPHPC